MTAPNAALAYRVLDHIDAHPEQWDQGIYIGKAECGTVGCFAGWTVLLSGDQPRFLDSDSVETSYADDNGRVHFVGGRAEELLGASRYVDIDDECFDDLFGGSNTRADLGRLVAEIFGPRPEGGSGGNLAPASGGAS